ncbi:NAD(P)-dependent oxidoreductase [Planomonospora venezuelensis]|uniref:3-hydroxyisobutyrate dehydrogenase n=1 Tax=Planomonospora venezuelensis TaxID=1999 RepID=A0A841DE20_PLAVE|nr:NAD(P)-dependent oxidoreductase [Planomonospora venezuelensis]MBB5966548.1 3-hydroxyisobutyrate dehydrogenase [Planomonospora venezuelensis]GIN02274.1 dehydrogenase [Planomonospora venezuelensis]
MTTVALLGTGIMGAAMARNLARAGLEVRVWNRTREKALPLQADGATVSATPAEAVAGADVVITMLSDGDAVHGAMSAAAPGLRAGQAWAQMSTVGVTAIDRLGALARSHGLVFVDAPVQGTRQPAEAGTLVVLAAGPADERLEPVFAAVGGTTLWVGEAGAATRLKLVTVGFGIELTSVLAEALALAEGLGVEPELFARVVTGGPMDSPYLQAKMKAVLGGDYSPSFTVRNAEKDTRLIAEAAAAAGVAVDLAEAAGARLRRAEARGHGDDDMAARYFAGSPAPA